MKRNKIILGLVVGLLVIAYSSSLLFKGIENVNAATRLYGVQQVVENISKEDPFVILELVPDEAYASLGAYVLGEEPDVDSRLLLKRSIDSNLPEGTIESRVRRDKVLSLFDGLIAERDADGVGMKYPMFYDYNTLYQEQISEPEDTTGWKVLEFEPTKDADGKIIAYHTEERIGYYEEVGEGGDYTATAVETEAPSGGSVSDNNAEPNIPTEGESSGTVSGNDVTPGEGGSQEADGTVSGGDAEVTVTYTYSYTPGQGTYRWVDANTEAASIYQVSFEKLYYKVTLNSNDWFAKSVFEYEENYGTANIEVIPITPSELETNIAKGYLAEYGDKKIQGWNGVDMLYISNSTCMNLTADEKALFDSYTESVINEKDSTVTYTNDVSAQTAYNIYEYVLNTSLPVIVDSSIVFDVTTSTVLPMDTNLQKLAFLLWDYTTETTPSSYVKADNTAIDVSSWTTQWPAGLTEILSANIAAKPFGTYGSVQGSVYFNSLPNMVGVGFADLFASVNFDDLSTDESYAEAEDALKGIKAVINEIDSENFYNELNGVDCTTEYNTDTERVEIAQSSVIKYILNFAYRRAIVYKDSITVLDVEPTRYSTLTPEKIKSWLKEADAERIEKIEIVQMTTSEFIGVLSDLNAEYDLIYIGDCIGPAGKHGSMNQEVINGKASTVYNESSMDGLIYTHIGDTFQAPREFKGLLNDEYNGASLTTGFVETRFSGNDITQEKVAELKDFVNSGYPVVVAEGLYTEDGTQINSARVDNASYLYEFLDHFTTKETKENVMSDKLSESALLATYLNMSKLYLSMISSPVEYAVTYDSDGLIENVQYLKEVNGKYTLEYIFELADNSEVRLDTVAYEVEAFIDTNADGRYDATEELDGLLVRDYETGAEVQYNQLVTGVRYTVTRELPDDYVGMIPWKLEVTQRLKNAGGSTAAKAYVPVHTSAKGYTAVPAKNEIDIKILQIIDNDRGALDLSTDSTFKKLFGNVKDMMNFNIDIKVYTVNQYVEFYNDHISGKPEWDDKTVAAYTSFYEEFFEPYDMVMVGFADVFDDINSYGATMALKLFVESGRSALFSHDTTSYINAEKSIYGKLGNYWGYHLNQNIRSIVGMDRYGITEGELSFLKNSKGLTLADYDAATSNTYKAAIEGLNKDIAYTVGGAKETSVKQVHGFSNISLLMQVGGTHTTASNKYGNVCYTEQKNRNPAIHQDNSRVSSISQVNKGQITSFPFDINIDNSSNVKTEDSYQKLDPATMTIAETHGQYYQLDLMLDKTNDKESDIVVWYCLADYMYAAVPNDVRNNYYIYSAGNITYTGMGHMGNKVSLDEAKLFVNTMIASYNAGKKDPTIAIIQDANNKGAIKQYAYRTYDAEFGMADTEEEVIHFYVKDDNIIAGTKTIALKYYVEIDENPNDEIDAERKELDANYISSSVSTINNNEVGTLILKPELFAEAFADSDVGSVKIYISAQTTLNYDSTRPDETTGVAFTSITVKARELFDLD